MQIAMVFLKGETYMKDRYKFAQSGHFQSSQYLSKIIQK